MMTMDWKRNVESPCTVFIQDTVDLNLVPLNLDGYWIAGGSRPGSDRVTGSHAIGCWHGGHLSESALGAGPSDAPQAQDGAVSDQRAA